MKRLFSLLLVVCVLLTLAACKKEPAADTTPETTTEATDITEVTDAPETTAVPETTAAVVYRNPLNGEVLDEPWTGRATAVMINNIRAALPHHGVSEARILYEIETEGGITRCLAIFDDLSDVGTIGPVRSARSYFNNVAVSYDAPLIHCGGSGAALNAQYDDSGARISDWNHIDQIYNGSYFYRDTDRYNYQGYAYEHTLFTTGELLNKALEAKGYNVTGETDFGLQFDENVELNGESAAEVVATFRGGKTMTMTYNADTGLYEASQYGREYIDANTDQIMTFRNVLVLYAEQWFIYDGTYNRSYYDLIGSGDGHLAIGGEIVPIKWVRENLEDPFTYTLEDGTPVTLGVGHSYIAIVDQANTASYK